jgi:hypothetical protein
MVLDFFWSIPGALLTGGIILDWFGFYLLLLPLRVVMVALFAGMVRVYLAARCTAWTPVS